MTVLEKRWVNRIADLGCVMCWHLSGQNIPACVHHVREGQGLSQRSSHYLAIPLCKEHHQGSSGWHGLGQGGFYTRYKLDELDLLGMTMQRLQAEGMR